MIIAHNNLVTFIRPCAATFRRLYPRMLSNTDHPRQNQISHLGLNSTRQEADHRFSRDAPRIERAFRGSQAGTA